MSENTLSLSVMIVDDDDVSTYLTKRTIRLTDFSNNVITFIDPRKAIAYLEDNKYNKDMLPDIIFLDVNMPLLSGWRFLDLFSTYNFISRPKVYMISSSDSVSDKLKSAQYVGIVYGYFDKPLKVENLHAIKLLFNK